MLNAVNPPIYQTFEGQDNNKLFGSLAFTYIIRLMLETNQLSSNCNAKSFSCLWIALLHPLN